MFLQFFVCFRKKSNHGNDLKECGNKEEVGKKQGKQQGGGNPSLLPLAQSDLENGFNHIENSVILSLTKPLQRMRNARRTAKAWKSFLLKRSMLSEPFSVVWICVSKVPRICVNRIPRIC